MSDLQNQFEEVKLVYRNKVKASDRPKLNNPTSAYQILLQSWDQDHIELLEEFKIILLDRRNRLMSIASISKGGYAGTVVDPKLLFTIALKRRAHAIILAHNHPSQDTTPSANDINLTKKLMEVGELLDIRVLDHIIVAPNDYCSLVTDEFVP